MRRMRFPASPADHRRAAGRGIYRPSDFWILGGRRRAASASPRLTTQRPPRIPSGRAGRARGAGMPAPMGPPARVPRGRREVTSQSSRDFLPRHVWCSRGQTFCAEPQASIATTPHSRWAKNALTSVRANLLRCPYVVTFMVDPLSLEWLLDISTLAHRCHRGSRGSTSFRFASISPSSVRRGRRPSHLRISGRSRGSRSGRRRNLANWKPEISQICAAATVEHPIAIATRVPPHSFVRSAA